MDSTTEPPEPRRTRLTQARRAAARRPLALVLVLGSVLVVLLVVAAALIVSGTNSTNVLIEPVDEVDSDLRVNVQLTTIDARSGELRARIVVEPLDASRAPGGVIERGFRLFSNDVRGQTTYAFEPGQPLHSIEIAVQLTGGSLLQYPFDDYVGSFVVFAGEGTDPKGTDPLRVAVGVTASLSDFEVSADLAEVGRNDLAVVDLDVRRPVSTLGFAIWMMALMWGLAIAGAGVVWAVVRWGVDLPWWAFGYLVGVLFALPPLRASLPGAPPSGGFVDFVAFYWAVAVVGVSLLLMLGLWLGEARRSRVAAP